ncbi:MAG TPA: DUF4139 domain-containing protein [Aestuariivirgaceae bacterium]|nr:DUF4139 domain-containing protein [Aestuariivirgaceae bacterium]
MRLLPIALLAGLACIALPPLAEAEDELALKRVMLSTGGVGYFEYEATVNGDATLSLPVRLDQVDDVLKSVIVFDDTGGVGTISLPGREPLRDVFRELPFSEAELATPVALLNALRGAEIETLGVRAISGRLMSVTPEQIVLPDGGGTLTRHRLSILTDDGVRQVILEDADAVRFSDPELQADIDAALAAVARHGERDRRLLDLRATGDGTRLLRVGYVVEAPLWKTAYRVSLPRTGGGDSGLFQGWAVLENLSGEDWEDVELTVVSGHPVTFRQALYDAYFVERPEVPVEVLGRILPRPDEGASPVRPEADGLMRREARAPAAMPSFAAQADMAEMGAELQAKASPGRVAPVEAALAEEAATQVTFRIPHPVSAPAGHSLMVPIISREVPATRVSLYQPDTHPRHPLASLRLTNDGDTGLPPGILTLYEETGDSSDTGTAFIGDARLAAFPAGEKRLVSFAVDQKVTVDRENLQTERMTAARIADGILSVSLRERARARYTIEGAAGEPRTVLVEHPVRDGWRLVGPERDSDSGRVETTGEHYRVSADLEPGESAIVDVVEERPIHRRYELLDTDDDQLRYLFQARGLPAELRQALAQIAAQRARLGERQRDLERLEGEIAAIMEDQARLRQNLNAVPRGSDLHQRYLARMDEQEDRLADLRDNADEARTALETARDAHRDYVRNLDL